MTDEQKRKKAQRERERRARIKEQQAKQESPAEPTIQPEPPKDWDLTYPYDREGNRVDQPTQKASTSGKDVTNSYPLPEKACDTHNVSTTSEPTQLDRIEALLLELVESNRRLHPNISELLNSGIKR